MTAVSIPSCRSAPRVGEQETEAAGNHRDGRKPDARHHAPAGDGPERRAMVIASPTRSRRPAIEHNISGLARGGGRAHCNPNIGGGERRRSLMPSPTITVGLFVRSRTTASTLSIGVRSASTVSTPRTDPDALGNVGPVTGDHDDPLLPAPPEPSDRSSGVRADRVAQ